jgi:3-hydroxyisobutyrate dehydrogenase-like beta-hydroxyacid dehydrogenase
MKRTLGFLGLGKMGAGMAARLIETGNDLVVWNRTAARTAPLVELGATAAQTPAEVAERADTIITMLNDDASAESVYSGPDGLLTVPVEGRLFIEMSTLRPPTSRELADRCEQLGAAFIDSPVSGSLGPARSGKLMALVGGSDENVERARPVLEAMTRKIVHLGDVGSGTLMKLVLNLPLAVYWQALAEGVALGHAGGLDLRTMLETINDSGGALSALSHKVDMIADDLPKVAFDIATMEKDVRSIIAMGHAAGLEMPMTDVALDVYSQANASGHGAEDAVVIVRRLLDSLDQARKSGG